MLFRSDSLPINPSFAKRQIRKISPYLVNFLLYFIKKLAQRNSMVNPFSLFFDKMCHRLIIFYICTPFCTYRGIYAAIRISSFFR